MDNEKKLNDKEIGEVNGGTNRPSMLKIELYCQHCRKKNEMDSFNIDHANKTVYYFDYMPRSMGWTPMDVRTDIYTCKVCGQKTEWVANCLVVDNKLVLPPE